VSGSPTQPQEVTEVWTFVRRAGGSPADWKLSAIQQALSGLAKLNVRIDDLKKALFPDGSPATPAEFKERFNAHLDQILKGRDASKVRLVIE